MPEILKRECSGFARVEGADMEKRRMRFLVQSSSPGTDRLVILPMAGRKHIRGYMENPMFLAGHQRYLNDDGTFPVLGKAVDTDESPAFTDEGLELVLEFADTPLGLNTWELYKPREDDKGKLGAGYMRAVSIGFRPTKLERDPDRMVGLLKKHGVTLTEAELTQLSGVVAEYQLREVSAVMFGADPKALAKEAKDGNQTAREILMYSAEEGDEESIELFARLQKDEEEAERGTISYKKYPLAPVGEAWNGPAQIKAADTNDLKKICTWFDSAAPDIKASYKLPHHKADGYKTVWRGVAAAMAVVFGARGGLKGKALADRKTIYNHLAKHYKDFDKAPPEFREENVTVFELWKMYFAEEIDVIGAYSSDGIPADEVHEEFMGCLQELIEILKDDENKRMFGLMPIHNEADDGEPGPVAEEPEPEPVVEPRSSVYDGVLDFQKSLKTKRVLPVSLYDLAHGRTTKKNKE